MKKRIYLLSLLTMIMVAMLSTGFVACSDNDDDDLGLSDSKIRELLEAGSGTWSVISIGDDNAYTLTFCFHDGKTNGFMSGNFSMWGTPYTVKGCRVYITEDNANNNRGDVLEGGIVITNLTKSTLEFYRSQDKKDKYKGTKLN